MAAKKPWRIIPRPLLETILNNHAQSTTESPNPSSFTAPQAQPGHITRPVGLLVHLVLGPPLRLPQNLGALRGVHGREGCRPQEPSPPNKYSLLSTNGTASPPPFATCLASKSHASDRASSQPLWERAVFAMSRECTTAEVGRILGFGENEKNGLSFEEASYMKESAAAPKLAKKIIALHQGWRANAITHMNRTGMFSGTLTHSCTDWPCLLLEFLSQVAEIDHFRPKPVINNIEVLKHATRKFRVNSQWTPIS
ncbi:unnamed protein product [Sphenostylis stenocarpa]|uniref:Uncharacterized protein n=1 Tax=Sphenostylis stenocarpa TaxID=92480 RepID=A0AA86VKV0_9FABA|nr:unnamed protein product [Sphenostylis stenocarpa]